MMCNPAEFFVDTMSKNTIMSENNKFERNWFPSVLLEQFDNEKTKKVMEPPDDEIVLLVVQIFFMIQILNIS